MVTATLRPFDYPTRDAALEWCRANAPDLRIQHGDGASGARFMYGGRTIELEVEGDDHRDVIVRRVFETIRERQGAPVSSGVAKSRELEQQIVMARYRGQDATADALERELLEQRAGVAPKRPVPRVPHEGVIQQQARPTRWQW